MPNPAPPTLRDAASLVAAGLLPAGAEAAIAAVSATYAIAIPPTLAALIAQGTTP